MYKKTRLTLKTPVAHASKDVYQSGVGGGGRGVGGELSLAQGNCGSRLKGVLKTLH